MNTLLTATSLGFISLTLTLHLLKTLLRRPFTTFCGVFFFVTG